MALSKSQDDYGQQLYDLWHQNLNTAINQYTPTTTTSGGTLGGIQSLGMQIGGYVYPNYPVITPQQLPDPKEVKKNFEDYLKRYLQLYSGMYTNPYEKELIQNLKGLLVLDKIKNL